MNNNEEIRPEVKKRILKNYNEILDAEKNHPENIVTFNTIEEMKAYFDSL